MRSARRGLWPLFEICSVGHNRRDSSGVVVFTKRLVVDIIDNVFSEGIDYKRFIRPSMYGETVPNLKIIEKERNEQPDLLRKEVMTVVDIDRDGLS